MSAIRELLERAVELDASDVHIKSGQEPFFRINGHLSESGFESLSAESVLAIAHELIPPHLQKSYNADHEADFSHFEEDVGRFRVNVFLAQGAPSIAMRYVRSEIPTFEQLRLPTQLRGLAQVPRGIVIVTGTTGSGKSTTLAAVMGEINRNLRKRIITVEDPIEYIFDDDQSVISQREVGLDTMSFQNALRHVMRQDPEVILIGEIRDRTSIRTALLAAETGHLVMTTLHAGTADQAIPRMLDMFPGDEQPQIRVGLAANLHGAICQRLLVDTQGGAIPTVEILYNTPTVRKMIYKNQLDQIAAAIETGAEDGMQSFNQSIYELIKADLITEEEGMRHATNPEALRMNLQGIFLDESRRILSQ